MFQSKETLAAEEEERLRKEKLRNSYFDEEDKSCVNCRKLVDKPKRCSKCQKAYYCSKDCQIKDWRTHKDTCKPPKAELTKLMEMTRFTLNITFNDVGAVSDITASDLHVELNGIKKDLNEKALNAMAYNRGTVQLSSYRFITYLEVFKAPSGKNFFTVREFIDIILTIEKQARNLLFQQTKEKDNSHRYFDGMFADDANGGFTTVWETD